MTPQDSRRSRDRCRCGHSHESDGQPTDMCMVVECDCNGWDPLVMRDHAEAGAAGLDALRAADFPFTDRVDKLAELVAYALAHWPEPVA